MTDELVALLDGNEAGRVHNDRGRLTFVYDDEWRNAADAYPLSLSMPLAAKEHARAAIEAFLWGLLPDNERVLDRWAAKFHVSARNAFALISHVGEDCAGAVQFVTPDRLATIRSGKEDKVEWLDEADIANRLQALRKDHAAWRLPRDTGQFSLAGAQPKTALLLQNTRWGIPSGRLPTTHILKPPTGQFDGHAENEHICLMLARTLGLPTAQSQVMRFGDEIAIVIERYDRLQTGNAIVRVHQEDICQALGIMPTKRYQNEGGPSPTALSISCAPIRPIVQPTWIRSLPRWASTGSLPAPMPTPRTFLCFLAPARPACPSLRRREYSSLRRIRFAEGQARHEDRRRIQAHPDRPAPMAEVCAQSAGEPRWADRTADFMAKQIPDEATSASALAREEGLDATIVERLTKQLIERAGVCERALTVTYSAPQGETPAAKGGERAS